MTNVKEALKDIWLGVKTEEATDCQVSRLHLLKQIEARWGKAMAENTDLNRDLMSFSRWAYKGYKILPQEKALIGVRPIPARNVGPKTLIRKPKPVYLYHRHQVRCVRY